MQLFLILSIFFPLNVCLSEEYDSEPAISGEGSIEYDLPIVPQKAFYKDVFLDAGIGLTSRKFLYAAQSLGLSLEGISFSRTGATAEETLLQNEIVAGGENDTNGRLLYPDGQPRYKLLFVNGGSSTTHGKSLSNSALQNMKSFVNNGGSYVGACAGAFFASNGYDGNIDYPYYLSLCPSTVNHTGISGGTTGMIIEQESPLLDYYDFGGDYYVSNVRHNKGGYPVNLPDGTEILARYDYPLKDDVHMQPCVWAYKSDKYKGRMVLEGSHPEEVSKGERRDLTAAMMLYAMDGVGMTTIKGTLQNGEVRVMDKSTEDNAPSFTRIGDMQCHHFIVSIPEDACDITFRVESGADCDLALMLSHESYAYPEDAEFIASDKGSYQQLSFSELSSGIWYVTVQCLTTVEVMETDYGQYYYDDADVLNGVPYQIVASWNSKILPDNISPRHKEHQGDNRKVYRADGIPLKTSFPHQVLILNGKKILSE